MRGYGESEKPSGVENYVMDKLDNDVKVSATQLGRGRKAPTLVKICKEWVSKAAVRFQVALKTDLHIWLGVNEHSLL